MLWISIVALVITTCFVSALLIYINANRALIPNFLPTRRYVVRIYLALVGVMGYSLIESWKGFSVNNVPARVFFTTCVFGGTGFIVYYPFRVSNLSR